MSSQKTIVVVGATGNQGSSVVRSFLTLPEWHVRAVTRNPSSPLAKELSSLGASLVQADLSDINSLSAAFTGAHAIFVNTDFWATYLGSSTSTPRSSDEAFNEEVQQGKNAAIAAAGIQTLERFVYSALAPIKKASRGKYSRSYHWDSKAAIVEYIENEQRELAAKTSFFYPSIYASNPLFMPKFDPVSGRYRFVLPLENRGVKLPIIAAEGSTGAFVRALVLGEGPGTKLLAYDSMLDLDEIASVWSRASGKQADIKLVSAEYMHEEFGIPWEVLEAPRFIEEYGYMGGVEGYITPLQLKAKVQTKSFDEWLATRDWKTILDAGEVELSSVLGHND